MNDVPASTPPEIELQRLSREIERCGWRPASPDPFEPGLVVQGARGAARIPARTLVTERDEVLAILAPGELEGAGRADLFPRFLDFSMETRLALSAARRAAGAGRVLVIGERRARLFRLPEETLEHESGPGREFEEEILPSLAARARGRGDVAVSPPSLLDGARALRGWIRHWGAQLAADLAVEPNACEQFLWKAILALEVARRTGAPGLDARAEADSESPGLPLPGELAGGWGLRCERERGAGPWTACYDSLSAVDDFRRMVADFDRSFSTRIFSGDAETHLEWLDRLEETSRIEQLRAELLMQARARFEPASVAWLFSTLDREQAGWRRDMRGLPPMRRRIEHVGWSVVEPLYCDVAGHGLGAALRDADRLAETWIEYDAFRATADPDERGIGQPDLFFRPPRGIANDRLEDLAAFVFSESLRVGGLVPEEEFGAGVALLLLAISWCERYGRPFRGIDSLDRIWSDGAKDGTRVPERPQGVVIE